MPAEPPSPLIPITDAGGRVTGLMDQLTADYLASRAPDPTQSSLDALLGRVTRVRVVPVGSLRRGAAPQPALLDTSDPAALADFRRCFAVVEDPATFGHCMCLGDPHLELYAGDALAATVGYHHGASIRWDAWRHDARLADPDRLLDWLSARGVDGPRREVEELGRRAEVWRRHAERWRAATPDSLRPFLAQTDRERDKELHRVLLDALRGAIPAAGGQVLALLGWFGSGAGPWSGYPSYESVAEQLLLHYPTRVVVDALTAGTPTDAEWRGAARFFAGWDFGQTRKADRARLAPDLRERLMRAAADTGVADNLMRAERAFKG